MVNLPDIYLISARFAAVQLVCDGLSVHTSWGIPYRAAVFTITTKCITGLMVPATCKAISRAAGTGAGEDSFILSTARNLREVPRFTFYSTLRDSAYSKYI